MSEPRTIRARIDEKALTRVTRMFNAGLDDIFNEVLQNARRAGATQVSVALTHAGDTTTVTITDDGTGIADPAVLLAYGDNGWDADLVDAEDAAGMGLLSLAHRGCTVASRRAPASGESAGAWRVTLAPEHFRGDTQACVHDDDDTAPRPHGTAITFEAAGTGKTADIRAQLESAARHYPLPVLFGRGPGAVRAGELLGCEDFLEGAAHVERWRGLVFGVFKESYRNRDLHENMNFHGLTLRARLPAIGSLSGALWTVRADIVRCPELQLVLPARKELVETAFLETLHDAARHAIYRAMAADPDPRPRFADYKRAQDAGIDIAPPPPELRPWRPAFADAEAYEPAPKRQAVGADALRVECTDEAPEAQALARAASRAKVAGRLFEPNRDLEGYAWYDALERIVDIVPEVTVEGRTCTPDAYPVPRHAGGPGRTPPARPDAIRMRLGIENARGAKRVLDLDADVVFAGDTDAWVVDACPLVTTDSDIDPEALAELMLAGFFSPSDDVEADSWESQRSDAENDALHVATQLLVCDEAARGDSIARLVQRDLMWLIPRERDTTIAVRDGKVLVTFGAPVAQEAVGAQ